MGSTVQSTNFTPSTFAGGITNGALLYMQAVTSSGAYFDVGDASKVLIFVSNGSSSDTGNFFIETGGTWAAGSRGVATSTSIASVSSATAMISISVPTHAKSDYSAAMSTAGSFAVLGPFDSVNIKSSDGHVFVAASTGSTRMCAAVYRMPGGST